MCADESSRHPPGTVLNAVGHIGRKPRLMEGGERVFVFSSVVDGREKMQAG